MAEAKTGARSLVVVDDVRFVCESAGLIETSAAEWQDRRWSDEHVAVIVHRSSGVIRRIAVDSEQRGWLCTLAPHAPGQMLAHAIEDARSAS